MTVVRLPGEYEPHERTVINWPCVDGVYGEHLATAQAAHAELARTISDYEPVTMTAPPGMVADAARLCGDGVEIVEMAADDSWFRDTGPIYVERDGDRIGTDWIFNSWGLKFRPYDTDATLARRWLAHAGHDRRAVSMVLEGGSVHGDGEGTLLTTAQCLLDDNRNALLDKDAIVAMLRAELGAERILWLPYGLFDDWDTDGHVDNVAAFARPGTVVLQGCADTTLPDHERMATNRLLVESTPDAQGRSIEIVDVPVLPFDDRYGKRVAVPYLNYYVGNGFVVVGVCGNAADVDMCERIAEQYPGRELVPLDIGAIIAFGGGGIHCITQQVPIQR